MIRAVLNTNGVVSALFSRGGAEAYALDLLTARKIQIYATAEILAEYEGVLRRAKFIHVSPKAINDAYFDQACGDCGETEEEAGGFFR